MIENFSLALSSLQAALTLGRAIVDARDTTQAQSQLMQFQDAIIDAQTKILDAQRRQTDLQAELEESKRKLAAFEDWAEERSRYSRRELAPGVFAYIETEDVGELRGAHKYCCNCFEHNRKSTLQEFRIERGRRVGLRCPNGCPDLEFHNYKDA
jgi:predicted negative regulator of RcsB-dependent stress response